MKKLFYIINIAILFCTLNACLPSGNFEKTYFIKNKNWAYNNICTYDVNITDTSSAYNLLFLLKHSYKYPHSNIWIQLYNTNPKGKTDTMRLEIPLAMADGMWLGTRANEIAEHRMNIGPNGEPLKFLIPGMYKIQIAQDMRINPLPEIISTGLALEKVFKK